ncbi:probable acyl-[acyl-carrier-protein]--UDP-N-acetylglucosamine O-acyltransferase, mitochondrial isoform X1 [Tanacetum coccineum]
MVITSINKQSLSLSLKFHYKVNKYLVKLNPFSFDGLAIISWVDDKDGKDQNQLARFVEMLQLIIVRNKVDISEVDVMKFDDKYFGKKVEKKKTKGEDNLLGKMIIGCNNVIGHHAVVGIKCQDMKYKAGNECFLEVGDNNEIREHVSIHRSSKPCDRTVIGDNNLIIGSCHIAHDCKVGSNNIFANNTLLAGHVLVEDHAHTAGAIFVHQFCHIGQPCELMKRPVGEQRVESDH